jgi:hypothetical protein
MVYRRFDVKVVPCGTGQGQGQGQGKGNVQCVSYQLLPERLEIEGSARLPSKVYKDVIVRGARESNLPLEYIQKLDLITDNGYNGNVYHCNVL